jgi:hypothetical protein
MCSAAFLGALLGFLGSATWTDRTPAAVFGAIAIWVAALYLRERGDLTFPLPQRLRQTEKVWANEFGLPLASAMWGFHIGLTVVTRINYGGLWALAPTVVALASPRMGAVIMCGYWVGRALPVWLTPIVLSEQQADHAMSAIAVYEPLLHRMVKVGLCLVAAITTWYAMTGGSR